MNSKEYYIDLIETRTFSYNKYWEKPIKDTRLRKDTETACEEIISYCSLIKTKLKKYSGPKDYTQYPPDIKIFIQNILSIVTDGRELHNPVEFDGRVYNHHCQDNGFLSFENDPDCDSIIEDCKEIQKILKSEEATKDLTKYLEKIYYFEHYEDGSVAIKINKINKVSGKFSFDGYMITFETINGRCDADGVLVSEVEDMLFDEIPNAFLEHPNTSKELAEILDSAEEITLETLKNDTINLINIIFESIM